ncbi:hypothetical protein Taro_008174 [Colocasia esculenta]|uniref:Uncharacterized protein n=1 Tax=Colocasia esculenta TaxID=4460 RepID=A0A843U1M8_COLES|nr:hypothetical protein [Colocasia esculenta]
MYAAESPCASRTSNWNRDGCSHRVRPTARRINLPRTPRRWRTPSLTTPDTASCTPVGEGSSNGGDTPTHRKRELVSGSATSPYELCDCEQR